MLVINSSGKKKNLHRILLLNLFQEEYSQIHLRNFYGHYVRRGALRQKQSGLFKLDFCSQGTLPLTTIQISFENKNPSLLTVGFEVATTPLYCNQSRINNWMDTHEPFLKIILRQKLQKEYFETVRMTEKVQ